MGSGEALGQQVWPLEDEGAHSGVPGLRCPTSFRLFFSALVQRVHVGPVWQKDKCLELG